MAQSVETANANKIAAAILAAIRIMRQGTENAATTRAAYIDEWTRMLFQIENPHAAPPP